MLKYLKKVPGKIVFLRQIRPNSQSWEVGETETICKKSNSIDIKMLVENSLFRPYHYPFEVYAKIPMGA